MRSLCLLLPLFALAAVADDITGTWKYTAISQHEVLVPPPDTIIVNGQVVPGGGGLSPQLNTRTFPQPMRTKTLVVKEISTFVFKADNDQLTGTREYSGKGSKKSLRGRLPIVNGKINGNEVSFGVVQKDGNYKEYQGTVNGKELKLRITIHDNQGKQIGPWNAIAKKQ